MYLLFRFILLTVVAAGLLNCSETEPKRQSAGSLDLRLSKPTTTEHGKAAFDIRFENNTDQTLCAGPKFEDYFWFEVKDPKTGYNVLPADEGIFLPDPNAPPTPPNVHYVGQPILIEPGEQFTSTVIFETFDYPEFINSKNRIVRPVPPFTTLDVTAHGFLFDCGFESLNKALAQRSFIQITSNKVSVRSDDKRFFRLF
ncbi:hypothetical protein [Pseudaestuariivita rosea]|uniref:hypothetical protein n=1 Tax=Pseudaestuariivita rosea TaxID=2763263 RepID=UPI001ABBDCBA|nr:hypothetical protein [Pseudaestuariivita rosea]